MKSDKCESYNSSSSRRTSSVGCISWLSHLLPHRHHGKSTMTSSSWSDDDSDSNDAAMTSYRDVTTSNGRGPQVQSTSSADQLPLSPVSTSSPTDLVETFDVYYVLPPPGKKRTAHRGPLPVPTTRWTGRQQLDHRGELTLTERRRPNTNCLLDAVPPTPSCCNDLRAATLPASVVNGWTSPPPRGLEYYKIPAAPVTAMYSRPRCACLACSDLSQPASSDTVDSLYRQPTKTIWRNDDDDDDVYYNLNEVDVNQLRRGCSCFGGLQARSTAVARLQGRPLLHGNPLTTYTAASVNYDAVPTPVPVPLSYANVRFWRTNDTTEPQYSVPVRLADCGAVYDNQDTIDRLQARRRGHHGVTTAAAGGDGRLAQVPVTSGVGNGHIMRFVELRQVRAANVGEDQGEASRQRGFQPYATEDRYLIAPTLADRTTSSNHLYCRQPNKSDPVYINVQNVHAWKTSTSSQISPDPLLEEDTEDYIGPANCDAAIRQGYDDNEPCKETVEISHEEEHLDEDNGFNCLTTNPDFSENAVQKTKDDDLHEAGSTTQLNKETTNESESLSCHVRSRSQQSETGRARPSPQIRLADAYLLRMSPPPPSHQADGRRRAAYSDPVRWVSPVSGSSTDRQRRHQVEIAPSPSNIATTRHGTSGRPNGFRSPTGHEAGGSVVKTAAMTCTNEALDEAIQRRNRKCKPSAIRRLQAAKAIVSGGPETTATFSSFEPIFEGVACSLRARSASLSDCNALAKARGHALNF